MNLIRLFEFFGSKLTIEPAKPMSPALIAVIVQLIQVAIEEAPQLIADLQAIFSNPNPTPADWEALRQKVLSVSYSDYVPASALPPGAPEASQGTIQTPQTPATGTAAPAPAVSAVPIGTKP